MWEIPNEYSLSSFDPEEDRWTLVQPMHSKRFGVGVAVVNRLLYAIGGFDGNDRLASMECYHPENNAWTVLPAMKLGRSGAGVAALNQHIYVVGGFDGQNHLASVERFDTEQQTWEMVAEIRTPRSALSLTVLDGKLFAMGGFDGQVFLNNVEVYDPAKNSWEDSTPLTSGRSGHASAVIYQPAVPSGTHLETSCPVEVGAANTNSGGAAGEKTEEPMVMEPSRDAIGGGSTENGGSGQYNGGTRQEGVVNEGGQQQQALNSSPAPAMSPLSGNVGPCPAIAKSICSYFNSTNSGRTAAVERHSQQQQQQQQLQVVNINSLLSEPGPSSVTNASPPIRIAKKREAESPTIPCTPPHDGEIKIRAEDPEPMLLPKSPPEVPAAFSGVKTFLPVVDFQNQKRFRDRRKVNPVPVRHPSYNTSGGGEPAAEPCASFSSGCAAMNKIKEVVKQKLFSPSMLMASSSTNGNGGGSSYQEKMKMNRSNVVTNRRSVLSNAEEDDSTESDNPMDEGR